MRRTHTALALAAGLMLSLPAAAVELDLGRLVGAAAKVVITEVSKKNAEAPAEVVASPAPASTQAIADNDWSQFLKSWESGCSASDEVNAFWMGIGNKNAIVLPKKFKALASGKPINQGDEEVGSTTVNITGTYYGVPVKQIVSFRDVNTFSGTKIVFAASKQAVDVALKGVKYSPDAYNKNLFARVVADKSGVALVCYENFN